MKKSVIHKKQKTAVLLLLALAVCLLICACSEIKFSSSKDKDALIEIEGASCSRAEAVFMLMEEKAAYEEGQDPAAIWNRPIGSETMSEYVKDLVADRLTRYTAAAVMSDRLAAYPSEEAKNAAGEEAVAAWTKISGLYDVDEYGITASDVNDLYYKKAVYDAVYQKITDDATAEITEDSTRVMKADYVFIPKSAGDGVASQIYQSVKDGTDFEETCSAAGYELFTGQVIRRGEMNSAFDSVAFALNDGEMSEVVESKDGYYLIHCIDDNLLVESASNYNEILANAKEEAFKDAYYDFSKESKITFDNSFWKKIDIGNIK